jgi:hypothetical protein
LCHSDQETERKSRKDQRLWSPFRVITKCKARIQKAGRGGRSDFAHFFNKHSCSQQFERSGFLRVKMEGLFDLAAKGTSGQRLLGQLASEADVTHVTAI